MDLLRASTTGRTGKADNRPPIYEVRIADVRKSRLPVHAAMKVDRGHGKQMVIVACFDGLYIKVLLYLTLVLPINYEMLFTYRD